eukprot:Gb_08534 [translate_table: standard]
MAQYQQDEFDYMVDDYEMADFNDDVERVHNRHRLDVDSESDDDFDAINKVTDTTAAQARRGKDIQGIHWDRLNFTRAKYRETRLQQYKNYENLPRRRHDLAKVSNRVVHLWLALWLSSPYRNVRILKRDAISMIFAAIQDQ